MGALDGLDGEPSSSAAVEEVEFSMADRSYPFVGVSAAERCEVRFERMLPRDSGRYAEFFRVDGADPDAVLSLAEEHPQVEASALTRRDDGGLFEFVVGGGCPARRLAELGAVPRVVRATEGRGRIVAEVGPERDTSAVIHGFLDAFGTAELVAKRTTDRGRPLLAARELERTVAERLTDRQQEVLRTAFEAGYYERPREAEGEDVAAELGISGATFSEHVRAAEANLLTAIYEGPAD